uniref:Uncharacterized protein n=1 Tax=Leptobrachium leishanense TaxID=445787 RepID=A0A8C5LXA3_9ANUR
MKIVKYSHYRLIHCRLIYLCTAHTVQSQTEINVITSYSAWDLIAEDVLWLCGGACPDHGAQWPLVSGAPLRTSPFTSPASIAATMGKSKRLTQAPGSPEARTSSPPGGIRDYFTPQTDKSAPRENSKMAAATTAAAPHSTASSSGGWEPPPDLQQLLHALPTREAATKDMRLSLSGEIKQVRQDLLGLTQRIVAVEEGNHAHEDALQAHSTQRSLHHNLFQSLTRKVEDLEKRRRRNNIRLRGLPEIERDPDLRKILTSLFNSLLRKAPDDIVKMERWHRPRRPRGPPGSPPRDVVCCLLRVGVKKAIMAGARNMLTIRFEGSKVELFQDVALLTLHTRRMLQPLTAALQQAGLQYGWLYPAGLHPARPGYGALWRRTT